MRTKNWQRLGVPHGWRSLSVLTVLVLAGLTWLGWPVWSSLTSPGRAQSQAEAPWLMAALVAGLCALAVAMWRDAGRRFDAMSTVAVLIVLNTLVRAVLNPSANGVEFVHVIPLLAGMTAGAPAGFLVGAASAIVSTITVGDPATMLPTQALVWGLSGMLGGLLWQLRPLAAWLASLPLAIVAGIGSGVLLNLMGWGQEAGTTTTSFHPGLPPGEVLARLWGHTVETSLLHDLTRGLTTMMLLAVVGLPLLIALRPGAVARALPGNVHPHQRIEPDAIARREDRTRLDHLWNQGEPPWTN